MSESSLCVSGVVTIFSKFLSYYINVTDNMYEVNFVTYCDVKLMDKKCVCERLTERMIDDFPECVLRKMSPNGIQGHH